MAMQSSFGTSRKPSQDRQVTRLRNRGQALREIEDTGKCPGLVPWPLEVKIDGHGPNPTICSYCDLYIDCPVLDKTSTYSGT